MSKLKTFPNVFWITINILIVIFFLSLTVFMGFVFLKNKNIAILIPLLFMLLLAIMFYIQLSNHFVYISRNEVGIKINQPLKFKFVKLNWNQLKGYSVSEIWFGKNLFCSKSFIIYSNDERVFEIIKICNFGFNEMLLSFNDKKIYYLGKEPYDTGFYSRKYMFKK